MHYRQHLTFLTLTAMTCLVLSERAGAANPALNVVYSFTNGPGPAAGVARGTDGNLYGVTATGGPDNDGGIFEVSSNGVLITNIWLNGTNGAAPLAPLIPDKSGNFYGTASRGGVNNNGTIFKITSANQFQLLANFSGGDGSTPQGPLLEAANGWFYGTTLNGGSNNLGTIFRVNSAGVFSNLYSFSDSEGANPASGLIQGSNGNFYGTTEYGGANGLGTVFELSSSNTLTNLGSFTAAAGAFPGGLAEDTNGNFYGPAINGGTNFAGTIFELSTNNNLETLVTFGITNGANPNWPLTAGSQGNWYGTTEQGGAYGQGTIFVLNTTTSQGSSRRGGGGGLLTDAISFNGTDGAWPRSGLILGSDGNFYGTTSAGGAHGYGEIYQVTGFAPFIITPAVSQSYASNHTATFSVTAGGSTPLSYQWLFDGTNDIPDATNASLTISHEQLTNSGTYTVIVSNAFGSVSNDAVLSVVAPIVTIVSPPLTVTNSSTNISGTASDPNGIATVLYQLNSNGWFTASGTTKWRASLALQPGTNLFQVQSFDPIGNPSAIKSATIFYATISPLTLQTNGQGSTHTDFTGTNLIVDRSYTMQAVPRTGWLFLSWTGSVTATNNPLTFVMQSNMTMTANFVTNPFIAAKGTYEGLFFTSNAVAEPSAGLLSSLVIETTGAYSGLICVKGIRYSFTGSFDPSEQSSTTVARIAAQGGPLAMSMTLSADEVTGSISGTDSGGWTSALTAERVGKFVGSAQYTMLIPPGQSASSNAPPGYGYALAANHSGTVTLSGALADGAALSQTVSIVGNGDVPFYVSLYSNTGLLLGWLNINSGLTTTNLWWIKPATNGFTNMVTNILTSAWTKPPANYLPSGMLMISNTSLDLDFVVSITNSALLKQPGSPTNSLTGIFYPTTGLLQITFGNGAGRGTTTGYAAILGDSTNGGGYFLTKTNAGTITLGP